MDINIGKILIQPKDTWISTQAYEYLNLVRYNKNLYICKSVTGAPVGTLPTNTKKQQQKYNGNAPETPHGQPL